MAENKPNRFVSPDFSGVTHVKGKGERKPLLKGRLARVDAIAKTESSARGGITKRGLIVKVAEVSGLRQPDASKAVEAVIESIARALKEGDDVRIAGFGTFTVAHPEVIGFRNPRTGKVVKVKSVNSPQFKAGKHLRDMVG